MEPISLYIHWPFCLSKCPYCDFNSHVRDSLPERRFVAALRRELKEEAIRLGRRPLASIFFGGGTPGLMAPESVAALIADAAEAFAPVPDCEITLEANPSSVEAGKLAAFRAAGVNRLSLGVQSLKEEALRFLGRRHSVREATAALSAARAVFERVSFDLIYAWPGQEESAWRAELCSALALAGGHLSLYQLTIEPGTVFAALARQGKLALPDPEQAARLYEATMEETARAGFAAYELSNFAVPGQDCRHNLTYWRYGDYAGIGAGAHGRVTREGALWATRRHRAPEIWAERVEREGVGIVAEEKLGPPIKAQEMLLMGLRLSEGVAETRFAARTGMKLADALVPEVLAAAEEAGYLEEAGGVLRATPAGRLRLDALLAALLR